MRAILYLIIFLAGSFTVYRFFKRNSQFLSFLKSLLIALLFILIIGIPSVIGYNYYSQYRHQEATHLIKKDNVVLSDINISHPTANTYTYSINGRVVNNSSLVLDYYSIALTISDCSSSSNCVVIYEQSINNYEEIPTHQARDFKELITLPNSIQIKGKMQWNYVLQDIRNIE